MTEVMEKGLEVGQEVKWESNGVKKRGVVAFVIPAGEVPAVDVADYSVEFDVPAKVRGHESYLVHVPRSGDKKASLYWPVTSKLRPVKKVERQPDLPGAPARGPLGDAMESFITQALQVAEERRALNVEGEKIKSEMRKIGKESLTIEAGGEKYVFRVREQSFKLSWHRVKGEKE